MHVFREEVTADAVRRGLARPRLSGPRIGLLCLVLLVPAGALALALDAAHQRYPLAFPAVSWFVLSMVTIGVGASPRLSGLGPAAASRIMAAAAAGNVRARAGEPA